MRTSRSGRVTIGLICVISAMGLSACSHDAADVTTESSNPAITADPTLTAMLPEHIRSSGELTIATDPTYRPMEFAAAGGASIEGVDIDLGNAIAAKLGLTPKWQSTSFGSLVSGVAANTYNAAMSSISINQTRTDVVNLVSYFKAGTWWASQQGNPKHVDPAHPCGHTVAVQSATVQLQDLKNLSTYCPADKPLTIQEHESQTAATSAVMNGTADAMLADSPVISFAITDSQGTLEGIDQPTATTPYGIAIAKNKDQLPNAVQQAVNELIKDGTYSSILAKWNSSTGAIPKSEIYP